MARALLIAVPGARAPAAPAVALNPAERLVDLPISTGGWPPAAPAIHTRSPAGSVREIIWNCRSWWAGAEAMGPCSGCLDKRRRPLRRVDKTLAHGDHIHVGLSRAGARKRTSFWARGRGRPPRP